MWLLVMLKINSLLSFPILPTKWQEIEELHHYDVTVGKERAMNILGNFTSLLFLISSSIS